MFLIYFLDTYSANSPRMKLLSYNLVVRQKATILRKKCKEVRKKRLYFRAKKVSSAQFSVVLWLIYFILINSNFENIE